MSDKSAFLSKVPLFTSLKPRQRRKLADRLRERTYASGETIIEQGTNGIGLFVIVSGQAEVKVQDPDGNSRVIDHKKPNDFVGELSLLDDAPRTASVIATEDTTCYALFKLDFLEVLESEPQIAIELLKELGARFRRIMTTL